MHAPRKTPTSSTDSKHVHRGSQRASALGSSATPRISNSQNRQNVPHAILVQHALWATCRKDKQVSVEMRPHQHSPGQAHRSAPPDYDSPSTAYPKREVGQHNRMLRIELARQHSTKSH
jgi:hypothetical protein